MPALVRPDHRRALFVQSIRSGTTSPSFPGTGASACRSFRISAPATPCQAARPAASAPLPRRQGRGRPTRDPTPASEAAARTPQRRRARSAGSGPSSATSRLRTSPPSIQYRTCPPSYGRTTDAPLFVQTFQIRHRVRMPVHALLLVLRHHSRSCLSPLKARRRPIRPAVVGHARYRKKWQKSPMSTNWATPMRRGRQRGDDEAGV